MNFPHLLFLVAAVWGFQTRQISVYLNPNNTWTWKNGLDPNAVAMGSFEDSLNATGWGILNIKTKGSLTNAQQAFAAGYAEGVLTAPRIWEMRQTMWEEMVGPAPIGPLMAWAQAQMSWTQQQVDKNPSDTFWQQVGLVLAQFNGVVAGYNVGNPSHLLEMFDLWAMNSDGDLFQIIPTIHKERRPKFDQMSNHEIEKYLESHGRCSALIKVTGNFSNLLMGHSSWYTYLATNRIFKYYDFSFTGSHIASSTVAFSSYPGYIVSLDDYYIMKGSGLGMVQTSIGFTNASLYDLITHDSLLAWQRVRVANHLAHNGSEWHQLFKTAASGTYCNTYMVVDFNRFTPGKALPNDLLWLIEEIPGVCAGMDLTPYLQMGYWPSYNVPFQDEATKVSGYRDLADQGVASASFQLAPRANIFRRDSDKVVDLESFKSILRYNQYKTDPYADQNACAQICCRGDISDGRPGGCYDTKVTDYYNFWDVRSWIVNGPTTDSGLPPFSWNQFPKVNHTGLPAVYDFDFVVTTPFTAWNP